MFIIHRETSMVMKISLLYSNQSSWEIVARPCQALYIFRCKSCEFHLRDFWGQITCEGKVSCPTQAAGVWKVRSQEGWAKLGCLPSTYMVGLQVELVAQALSSSMNDHKSKLTIFPGIPWLLFLHLYLWMSRSSLAND